MRRKRRRKRSIGRCKRRCLFAFAYFSSFTFSVGSCCPCSCCLLHSHAIFEVHSRAQSSSLSCLLPTFYNKNKSRACDERSGGGAAGRKWRPPPLPSEKVSQAEESAERKTLRKHAPPALERRNEGSERMLEAKTRSQDSKRRLEAHRPTPAVNLGHRCGCGCPGMPNEVVTSSTDSG